MPSGTVKATWVGPFKGALSDGTQLVPGVTQAEVPADEAKDSDNWQVKGERPVPKRGEDE